MFSHNEELKTKVEKAWYLFLTFMFHLKRYRRLLVVVVLMLVLLYQWETIKRLSGVEKFSRRQLIQQQKPESHIKFQPSIVKYVPYETIVQTYKSSIIEKPDGVDWSKLAYVFYATSAERLLSVLVNIQQLVHYGTSAQFELIYTFEHPLDGYENREKAWEAGEEEPLPTDDPILKVLQTKYSVNVRYLPPLTNLKSKPGQYWEKSFSKFHLWKLVNYDRVIFLDADGFIMKNMDQLFFIPPSVLSTPIEYGNVPIESKHSSSELAPTPLEHTLLLRDLYHENIIDEMNFDSEFYMKLYNALPEINESINIGKALDPSWKMRLNSYLMVCTPSMKVWNKVKQSASNLHAESWDMELVNEMWDLSGLIQTSGNFFELEDGQIIPAVSVIPHAPYAMLSGEFKLTLHGHENYLTPPMYTGLLGDPKFHKVSLRELERTVDTKDMNIEDSWETFNEVGLWDWGWRFAPDGTVLTKRQGAEEESEDMFYAGMGPEKYGWEPKTISQDLYYLHWSDYPLPKPWMIMTKEALKKINWPLLNDWARRLETMPEFPSLKPMDDIAQESYTECINSRGAINDDFGKQTCLDSIVEWKKVYVKYWKVMSMARY